MRETNRRHRACGPVLSLLTIAILLCGACAMGEDDERENTHLQTGTLTLALGGDTMLGRLVGDAISEHGPAYPWGNAAAVLKEADLALVNLECVIAAGGEPFRPARVFYFRAPPAAIETLKAAGVDYVSMANNHAMDYGAEALLECIGHLDEAGIAHAGAGRDIESAGRPAMLQSNGLKVAVISCADHYKEYSAGQGRPGTRVIEIRTEGEDFDWIRSRIKAARRSGADLVVFSIHWGPNMREVPTSRFVSFAHAVVDAGVDIFHGHSAHVFQGVEIYRGRPILYDTGELVDDYVVDPHLRNDLGLIYLITVRERAVAGVEMVPTYISRMQVNLADGPTADMICSLLRRRSEGFGTVFRQQDDRIIVQMPEQ